MGISHLVNNRFVNNSGIGVSNGGGLMLVDCLEGVAPVLVNNIIVGNSAYYGGGVRIQNSTVQVINNTIAYNDIHHTNMDTWERVTEEEMQQASVVMAALIYHAAMRDGMFPRREER